MSFPNRTQSWRHVRGMSWKKRIARFLRYRARRPRPTLLFCTTNGNGTGHLTRALSVALALRRMDPGTRIIFLISTPDLALVRRHGFATYYAPYFAELQAEIGWENWNDYVRSSSLRIFDNHSIQAVVFDGYVPFFGLVDALDKRRRISRVWIRRGLEKPEFSELPDDLETVFDYIIRPQEAGQALRPFDGKALEVAPILSFDRDALDDRRAARAALGVPADALVAYVQLGSGAKFDNSQALADVIEGLGRHPEIFTVLAMSTLSTGEPPPVRNGIVIRNYPNYPYFNAFDFAVSAAGYNSFHELLACRIPTIFVPRESDRDSEDQVARAMIAERAGAGAVLRGGGDRARFRAELEALIGRMKQPGERARLAEGAAGLLGASGTRAAAEFVARVRQGGKLAPP